MYCISYMTWVEGRPVRGEVSIPGPVRLQGPEACATRRKARRARRTAPRSHLRSHVPQSRSDPRLSSPTRSNIGPVVTGPMFHRVARIETVSRAAAAGVTTPGGYETGRSPAGGSFWWLLSISPASVRRDGDESQGADRGLQSPSVRGSG